MTVPVKREREDSFAHTQHISPNYTPWSKMSSCACKSSLSTDASGMKDPRELTKKNESQVCTQGHPDFHIFCSNEGDGEGHQGVSLRVPMSEGADE